MCCAHRSGGTGFGLEDRVTRGVTPTGGDDNAGLKAARPAQSLSRLPVAVVKSMLQKNIRRGRAEAAVRCALELALKSWSDAIRRVLVIIVEDSLLHPAAPLLTWLMVATSKGYRPPLRLLEAFLCVVHETAACPVTGGSNSSFLEGEKASTSGEGTVLAKGSGSTDKTPVTSQRQPPSPPRFDHKTFPLARPRDQDAGYANREDLVDILQPFGYAHESVLSALEGNGWTAFLVAAHAGTGMPPALRTHVLAHVVGVGSGRAGERAGDMKQKSSSGAGGGAGGGGGGGEKMSTAASTATPPNRLGPIIREADAILSGVDFHCSGVLDELLRSTAVAARVGKAISESRGPRSNDVGDSASSELELVGVRQAAKQAMWACSSGINTRRLRVAFLREAGEESEETEVAEGNGGCCLSSPGYLEETERVVGVGEDGVSLPVGNGGGSSSGIDARVWAAMSSDVSGWTTKFVRGRLSRG
ncbi:conserved unknown protein [Ectocarpus siliculosus]|uniref:Uncharacterized protein n=1 Tax=Ectocarpus siliculosus TaxID=2880 RepID=D7G4U0_ECTSI|nr:conserved unknown protein [Ectocarpus siliculosus]|eukprot:CBJ27183.1 conserved unknown protein [Ectocarpus siliculosus]